MFKSLFALIRIYRRDRKTLRQCKQIAQQTKDAEKVIEFLKAEGRSQGVSVAFLNATGIVDEFDAKTLVFESPAWREDYDSNRQGHENLYDGISSGNS